MFEELQAAQEQQREGWMVPADTPPVNVLDRLAQDLQHGDVALVLTRADLGILIGMVDKAARTDDENRIWQNLCKLRDAKR